jgi:glycosyltransferase involved in cell wall biosynthesis
MPDDAKFFDLLIVDDIYPSTFSPFRTVEYNHYMWFFDAAVLSLEGWHLWLENRQFAELSAAIDERFKSRVFSAMENPRIGARLAYVTFLGNAFRLLPLFESQNLPFILQLYPAGGFAIGVEEIDAQLRAVVKNPLCVKVIATQTNTRDYLTDVIKCDPEKIEFIFGGVFDSRVDFSFQRDKKIYGKSKDTLDICFVAHKYGTDLSSKGYDYFAKVAKRLAPKFQALQFHVVGGYQRDDVDLAEARDRFTFYGAQPSAFFADFYPRMDAIISFNRPFRLAPGSFDGFPTGCCLEAGFRGVANIINDPLNLNIAFKDGEDLILLDDDFEKSVSRIEALLRDPARLAALGERTCAAFRRVMDVDKQLWARSKLIADQLHKHRSLVMVNVNFPGEMTTNIASSLTQPLMHRIATLEWENGLLRRSAERRAARLSRRSMRTVRGFIRKLSGRSLAR